LIVRAPQAPFEGDVPDDGTEPTYEWIDEWLCEHVDGTMDPSLEPVFEKYVEANPELKAHVERLRKTREVLVATADRRRHPPSRQPTERTRLLLGGRNGRGLSSVRPVPAPVFIRSGTDRDRSGSTFRTCAANTQQPTRALSGCPQQLRAHLPVSIPTKAQEPVLLQCSCGFDLRTGTLQPVFSFEGHEFNSGS